MGILKHVFRTEPSAACEEALQVNLSLMDWVTANGHKERFQKELNVVGDKLDKALSTATS